MRPESLEKKYGHRINMEKKLVWMGLGLVLLLAIYYFFYKNKSKKNIEEFQASPTFQGSRKNRVFKLGNQGQGYYLDK